MRGLLDLCQPMGQRVTPPGWWIGWSFVILNHCCTTAPDVFLLLIILVPHTNSGWEDTTATNNGCCLETFCVASIISVSANGAPRCSTRLVNWICEWLSLLQQGRDQLVWGLQGFRRFFQTELKPDRTRPVRMPT